MTRPFCAFAALAALLLPLAPVKGAEVGSPFNFYPADMLSTVDSSLLIHDLPLLTLLDGHRLPISTELGRMGTTSESLSLSYMSPAVSRNAKAAPSGDGKDYPNQPEISRSSSLYYGGEIGAYYGTTTGGKYSRSDFGSYIVGTVGNEHVQITAGASYQESNEQLPRRFGR
jgi:hypothetical protein